MRTPLMFLGSGDSVGRYVVEELLGRGGMGAVYRARDTELGRQVALKVISGTADETAVARFKREARAACAFSHPNAATVFDVGTFEGSPYLVMELLDGSSLRAVAGDEGTSRADKLRWLVEVARALDAAHRAGLVHRDVKPDNVIVTRDGVAKLVDFGIARGVADKTDGSAPTEHAELATVTGTGGVVGSPAYMAPEQLRGESVGPRADQFAWGVTAFEVLSGRLPWRSAASTFDLAASILHEAPLPLAEAAPTIDPAVARAVMRCLARDPDARFASMGDLVRAVGADTGAQSAPLPASTGVAAPAAAAGTVEAPRRGAAPWLVMGAVAVVLVGGYYMQRSLNRAAREEQERAPAGAPTEAILGLNDEATKRREDEERAAPPAPSGPPHSTLARRCKDVAGCQDANVAWCDDAGRRVTCCAKGLVGTLTGRCGCPPGGTDVAELIEKGCKKAPDDPTGAIQSRVRESFGDFRACFEKALQKNPKLSGKVTLDFKISADGAPWELQLGGVDVPDPEFQACVFAVLANVRFDPPVNGWTEVRYPIVFTPE